MAMPDSRDATELRGDLLRDLAGRHTVAPYAMALSPGGYVIDAGPRRGGHGRPNKRGFSR